MLQYVAKNRIKTSELFRVVHARDLKNLTREELAECYLKGYGVEKNDEKAIELYCEEIYNTERIIISSDKRRRAKAFECY